MREEKKRTNGERKKSTIQHQQNDPNQFPDLQSRDIEARKLDVMAITCRMGDDVGVG